jgi:hypothetical protein
MKTKAIEKNQDTGQTEVFVSLSNQEIIFLNEAVNMYIQKDFSDSDDTKMQVIKQQVKEDLHHAWTQLNPS